MSAETEVAARCTCAESKILRDVRRALRTPEGESVLKHADLVMYTLDRMRSGAIASKQAHDLLQLAPQGPI